MRSIHTQKTHTITVGFLSRQTLSIRNAQSENSERDLHPPREAKIKSILLLEMETSGNLKGMEPTLGK